MMYDVVEEVSALFETLVSLWLKQVEGEVDE